jgi:hypothetical protein
MPVVSMIRQRLGNKTFTSYVPADDENAKALAEAVLPGEYEILTKVGESGSDVVTGGYRFWTVMIKNDADLKTYLSFVAPLSKNSNDVINALKGKIFNSVKADNVVVINSRTVNLVTADAGDGEG